MSWNENNTSESIVLLNELRVIPLNVTFWVSQSFFGRFLLFLMRGHMVSVELRICEKPSWCTAVLQQNYMTFTISDAPETQKNRLSVQLDDNAPGSTQFKISMEASVHSLKSPFSILKLLQKVSYSRHGEPVYFTIIVFYERLCTLIQSCTFNPDLHLYQFFSE